MHRDLRCGVIDFTKVIRGKFNSRCSDIFFQTLESSGAWYWNNPGLLGEEPGECDLARGRFFPVCDPGKQVNQGLIRYSSLRRKARDGGTDVGTVERGFSTDLPGDRLKFAEEFTKVINNIETEIEFLKEKRRELVKNYLFRVLAYAVICTKHPGFAEEVE